MSPRSTWCDRGSSRDAPGANGDGGEDRQRHACVYRPTVVDNVEVINSKIDDTAPFRILNVAVLDVPFFRDRPVEHLGAGCHLMGLKRDQFTKAKRLCRRPSPVMLRQSGNSSQINSIILADFDRRSTIRRGDDNFVAVV